MRALPQLRDVASDQQNSGLQLSVNIDRDTASRMGILPQAIDDTLYDAFGQRQVSIIFTQLNQYRIILEVRPEFQQNPDALQHLYVRSQTGDQVPLSAFCQFSRTSAPLVINHQSQFPSVTLSFNLAPDVALGDAVDGDASSRAEHGSAERHSRKLPRHGASVSRVSCERARAHSRGSTHRLHRSRRSLRELHPSHHDSCPRRFRPPGVGALLALILLHSEVSVIAVIGIILAHRDREEERRSPDDRLCAQTPSAITGPRRAMPCYQACLLRFRPIMMTTMAALARRVATGCRAGDWRGIATTAWGYHRRWTADLAGPHAVHHAGHLFVHDSFLAVDHSFVRAGEREWTHSTAHAEVAPGDARSACSASTERAS